MKGGPGATRRTASRPLARRLHDNLDRGTDEHRLFDAARTVLADVASDDSATSGVADQDDVDQVEELQEFVEVIDVGVDVSHCAQRLLGNC